MTQRTDHLSTSMRSLADRLDMPAFIGPMLRLIARGDPVPLDRLAADAHQPAGQIEAWLRAQPGTDWDGQGRLLGFGLTQRPTPHRFVTGGRTLYTFCAADTLLFPPLLGQPASVHSRCPATGRPIHIEVTPDAVISVDPATTVVSQVCLDAVTTDIRGEGCDHGHFYATAGAARDWQHQHPDGDVLPVAEFYTTVRSAIRELAGIPLRGEADEADR